MKQKYLYCFIEFWNSHVNVRGPREAPKPQKDQEKKPDAPTSAPPAAPSQPESAPQPDSDNQPKTAAELDPTTATATATKPSNPTLFHEFCPITTRSPGELDYGSGQGALCFINPLFLQTQNPLSRRRMFKRSLKVRVSTESSTLLSPPIAPPPPPPLMPKTKGKCKAQKQEQQAPALPSKGLLQGENPSQDAPGEAPSAAPHFQLEMQEQMEPGQSEAGVRGDLQDDSDYMQPSPMIALHSSLSPYLSPSVSPMPPPLFPKASLSPSPHDSPGASPPLSPYQSPSPSPQPPFFLSPYDSPSPSPSLSPYQSPSPSPKMPFSLSPFTSPAFPQLAEQAYHTPATPQLRAEREAEEGGAGADEDVTNEDLDKKSEEEEERGLVLQVNDTDSYSSFSSLEGAAETPPHSPHKQDSGTNILDCN